MSDMWFIGLVAMSIIVIFLIGVAVGRLLMLNRTLTILRFMDPTVIATTTQLYLKEKGLDSDAEDKELQRYLFGLVVLDAKAYLLDALWPTTKGGRG